MDKLRLALVFCLTCAQLPSGPEFEKLEAALQEAGADLAALAYVRRMRRMKLTGSCLNQSIDRSITRFQSIAGCAQGDPESCLSGTA